jgi:hypothetical protein
MGVSWGRSTATQERGKGARDADVQEFTDDGRARHLDKYDVIEADAVERIEEREAALNLVRLDHSFKDVVHGKRLALAREMVSDGEDGAEVVGRMAPCELKCGMERVGYY